MHFSLEVFKDVHVVGVKTSCFKKRMLVFPEILERITLSKVENESLVFSS